MYLGIFNQTRSIAWMSLMFLYLMFFYYPFGGIDINYFHNDDYLLINRLSSIDSFKNLLLYIFSYDFYKIRPIAKLLYFFEFKLFYFQYNLYIIFNFLLFSFWLTLLLKFFFDKYNFLIKCTIPIIIITSKFFVYHLWNINGSFEILSLIFFTIILKLLADFQLHNKLNYKFIIFLSFVLIFTNERYLPIILFLPFACSAISKESFAKGLKEYRPYILSTSLLIIFIVIRIVVDIPIFVGTQTSNIISGFNVKIFFYHFFVSIFEVMGFSTLPQYLSGYKEFFSIPFDQWKSSDMLVNFVFLILFLVNFFVLLKNYKKMHYVYIFIIGLIIITSSVTFRVELRWLSPAFLVLLIFYSHFFEKIYKKDIFSKSNFFRHTLKFIVPLFVILFLLNNIYYTKHYRDSLYFGNKFDKQTLINKKI